MKTKMLMAPCKRKPILRHYQNAVEVSIWYNNTTDAKDFVSAAVKKFGTKTTSFSLIEFHYSDLSKRVRFIFRDMNEDNQKLFSQWLKGYAYAKGWNLPLYNILKQPKLF